MFPEDEVLRRIVPSPEETEKMRETAGKLMRVTADYMKAEGVDAEIRLAGSFSKGTFLSDPDLDLFIMFPEDFPRGELERIGLKAGDDILHGERMFSDHPYTRGTFGGMDVDMVPCYRLGSTDKLKSAVDRTPFHTSYILSRLSPEQKDQVRLLKKFMKGIGAYGAEQDSRGFSGYLCEILVVKYGSFRGVLSASRSWRKGTAIVIEEEGPRFDSPLVVYDPVDPRRNVASAVHEDTLALFITAAAAYLSDPGMKFFFPEKRVPPSRESLKEKAASRGTGLVTLYFDKPQAIEDSIFSQLWKTQYAVCRKLDSHSFGVIRAVHGMKGDKLAVMIETETPELPKVCRHSGPPVWVKSSDQFLKKWNGGRYGKPFIEDGVWTVIAERPYQRAEEMLRAEIRHAGIGKNIDPGSAEILGTRETLERADELMLAELLDPRFPWENRCRRQHDLS